MKPCICADPEKCTQPVPGYVCRRTSVPSVAQRIERIFKECSGVWGQSGISSWERDRLEEWRGRQSLSPKQEAVLKQIERKAFPDEHED